MFDDNKIQKLKHTKNAFLTGALNDYQEYTYALDIFCIEKSLKNINKKQLSQKLSQFIDEISLDEIINSNIYKRQKSVIHKKFIDELRKRHKRYLFEELISSSKDFYNKYECKCEKYGKIIPDKEYNKWNARYSKFECEKYCSNKAKEYNCEVIPYTYVYCRTDRFVSELIYALYKVKDVLQRMPEYNIVEPGCGPAFGLVAIDYFNKINQINKHVNYAGIDYNDIWHPVHKKIKEYIDDCEYPYIFGYYNEDVTNENAIKKFISNNKKPNIICINYLVSWFYEKKENIKIMQLFRNVINLINRRQDTVIIINDVDSFYKGSEEFQQMNKILETNNIKYKSLFYDLKDKPTILKAGCYGDYNKCKSAQMLITIGGQNDN